MSQGLRVLVLVALTELLLRNPFVQVLPLEIGEFSGKEPAIAFNALPMAPHLGRLEIKHLPSPL